MIFSRTLLPVLFGCLFGPLVLRAQIVTPATPTERPDVQGNMTAQLRYVEAYKTLAIGEMQRTGIPASITLAQAILETNGGQSILAKEANNHFGLKCTSQWRGDSYHKDDDEIDADSNRVKSCFRSYARPQESYADHSKFLRRPRYTFLYALPPTDYQAWADGLDTAGYSFADGYGQKLTDIIERYRLFEYDVRRVTDFTGDANYLQRRLGWLNDVPMLIAEEGETLAGLARAYGLQPGDLVRSNDNGYAAAEALPAGAFVFLAEKREQWSGRFVYHTIGEGETLWKIAQLYGIRLASLRARNGFRAGQEPVPDQRLQLREPPPPPPPAFIVTNETVQLGQDLLLTASEAEMFLTQGIDPVVPTVVLSAPANEGFYEVLPGDTLFAIARRFGTSVAQLKQLNQLSNDSVRVGQKIRVP